MPVEPDIPEKLALQLKVQAQRSLTRRFIDAVQDVRSAQQVVVREMQPELDLASGADNGWNGTDNVWTQDFTGGTANAWNEAYSIDSGNEAEDKILGFVGIQLQAADTPTHGIRFVRGTGGSQGFSEEVHNQTVFNDDDGEAYLTDAIIFGLSQNGAVEHYIDETATDTVAYYAYTAEQVGENIAQARNPKVSGFGQIVGEPGSPQPATGKGSGNGG